MSKKIFKSIMLVSAVVLALGLAFVMGILYRYFGGQIQMELEKQAVYLAPGVEMQGVDYLEKIKSTNSRITLIGADGNVLYDSAAEVSDMENHSDREEIQLAEKYGSGKAQRMSKTLSERTIYYAVRLNNGEILRVSSTQYSVLTLVLELIQPILWILALMIVLSGIFAFRISKRIMEPVNALDLEHPEENQSYEEVEPLLSKIHRQNLQIKKQLDSARRQQEEFSIITENMQEGLLVIDQHTTILSGNASVWKIFHVHEPSNSESVYFLNRSEEFRTVIEQVLDGEHKTALLKLDGSHVEMIANPVTRGGTIVGAVLLLMNVTEKVERENLRREFSANVSHELKTPLTAISGFAEIIQAGIVREKDIPEFAGKIYSEAQRLIQLVEDTIKVSQLDEGEVPYEPESVDLYAISREVFQNLKEAAQKKNVHLYLDGERMIYCTVRPILEEVLYNLCDNAVKYNREDGTVSIHLREDKEKVTITVKDTGIGIPGEDQERVFERFYRVDKSHCAAIEGTGLGLSIVKHGVAFLGGTVELSSEEGKGTEITVILPKNSRSEQR